MKFIFFSVPYFVFNLCLGRVMATFVCSGSRIACGHLDKRLRPFVRSIGTEVLSGKFNQGIDLPLR